MTRRFVGYAMACFLLVASLGRAQAGLVVETTPLVTALQGSTGTFEVSVRYVADQSGTNPTLTVSGDTVALTIVAPGVAITGVDENTSNPYLFDFTGAGNIGLTLVDPIPVGGTSSVIFFDLTGPPDFPGRTMSPGDVFGLGRVHYSVAIDARLGEGLLLLDPRAPDGLTDLTDPIGNSIIADVSNGRILVTPVPEPSTVVVAALGLALSFSRRRGRRF